MPAVTRDDVERLLGESNGVLRLGAAWVAREWLPPGRRLGLPEDAYAVGERGFICERWLGSTTKADNRVGPDDEGLSTVVTDDGHDLTLAAVVAGAPDLVLGAEYAATHDGLGRLPKLFDYGARLPYHIHPRAVHSQRVGRKPKDEAYYYPHGADLGPHPETFFGVHPWIAHERAYETLLRHLERWDSDLILQHARAYLNVPGQGFHVPSGVLHAPGTALTLELQEDSDCLAMFQALNAGAIISKELLFKDVSLEDRARLGERYLLEWVDWEANGDPYFYENRRLLPQPIRITDSVREEWIYYNTSKFSGKRLVLQPGAVHRLEERGAYSLLAWSGSGTVAGQPVIGGEPGRDELLLVHATATAPHDVVNTGATELEIFTFFGPDINDVPSIPRTG